MSSSSTWMTNPGKRAAGQKRTPGGTFPQQDEGGGLQEPSPHTNTPLISQILFFSTNLDADPVGAAAMLLTGAVCQAVMKLCRAFRLRGEVR